MNDRVSISGLYDAFQEQHDAWIRTGTLLAVIGYGLSMLTNAWEGSRDDVFMEVSAFVLTSVALWLSTSGRAKWGAALALGTIWVELHQSLIFSPHGIRSSASVIIPLIIFSGGLFLGRRAVFVLYTVSLAALPITQLIRVHILGIPMEPNFVGYVVIIAVSQLIATVLTAQFLETFGVIYNRASQTAERMEELVRALPNAILVLGEDDLIEAINPAAERLLERSPEDLLGHTLGAIGFHDSGEASLCEAISRAQTADGKETITVTVATDTLELEASVYQTGTDDERALLILEDVTAIRRAERRAKVLERELQHAQKMEAVGRLAGGVAHDFNNLLTAIGGFAALLELAEDEETQELAGDILRAQERGAELTRKLLAFARKDVSQPRVLDVGALVRELRPLLERFMVRGMTLEIDAPLGFTIRADPSQLEQMILNLVSNARDAMERSGTVCVRVSSPGDPGLVSVEVSDEGMGMDQETARRIFEPFFTTKPKDKGTGLGLSTVHGIVTQYGGRIDVDSSPGAGTTFTILWPTTQDGTVDEDTFEQVVALRLKGRGERVLVVEDDDGARKLVERVLSRAGYEVDVAEHGMQALDVLDDVAEQGSADYDLVLTDVVMPKLGGFALADEVRQRNPEQRVLFMSGVLAEDPEDIDPQRAASLLLKPFTPSELPERVREALDAPR